MNTKGLLIAAITLISVCFTDGVFACTNLIVTKGASKDGSVMVTYAADSHTRFGTLVHMLSKKHKLGESIKIYEWGKERYLGEIPQVSYTYNVIGNMNEHQLVIGESTWGGREEFRDTTAILDYGSLIYLTLQRAKTARQAIEIYTTLADTYGYASSGESISIADANEAWFLEIISSKPQYENVSGRVINKNKGAIWVAVRIPDGYISAHANCARITTFPLNDPQNCLYSKNVIEEARRAGLYSNNLPDKDFSFADTYCPLDFSAMRACEARVWSFFNKHGNKDMSNYLDYAKGDNPKNRMPLYVKAKEKLGVKDVADMMRDHYEGTPFDMTKGVAAGGNELPYRWRPSSYKVNGVEVTNERAIATQQTGFWFVAQCRGWLPNNIGGLFWFAVDDAGTSALTPIYTCSKDISKHYAFGVGSMTEYSDDAMFWLQNRIAQFAYLRYNQIGAEVRSVVDKHEEHMIELIEKTDKQALELGAKKATKFLTKFSVAQADMLFDKWKKLDRYLLVKYLDGNTKKQNEDGSFKTNPYSKHIPVSPMWPGYSNAYKEAVAKEVFLDKL